MPNPYTRSGLAIVNPYGEIWTDRIFVSEEEALRYLRDYWGQKEDISRFTVARAHLELKLDRDQSVRTGPWTKEIC